MDCVSFRNGVSRFSSIGLGIAWLLAAGSGAARAQSASPTPQPTPATPPTVNETVVVSATQGPEPELEIPGEATVVTGEQLRERGVTNLADGIQDVMGVDTGMGSDNGPRQPNVGIWGLKEFDALLFMVDGVPVGGPFLPQLAQIDINDVDRIEIVKGPQGTLYGASAFAGMVQVFTRSGQAGTYVSLAGGSFNEGRVTASSTIPIGNAKLRVFGDFDKLTDGWQPNTDYKDARGGFRLDVPIGNGGNFFASYQMFLNQQGFGSPLPVDPPTGTVIPGFQPDNNYEFLGARIDHRVYALTLGANIPLNRTTMLTNTLGLTKDDATIAQSFLDSVSEVNPNLATSNGYNIKPNENDLYDDLHVVTNFQAAGTHRLVGGAAITTGRIESSGSNFSFDFQIEPVIVPNLADIPPDRPPNAQGRPDLRRALRQRSVDARLLPHDLRRRPVRHHLRNGDGVLERQRPVAGVERRRPVVGRRVDPRTHRVGAFGNPERPERLFRGEDELQAGRPGPSCPGRGHPLARTDDQRGSRRESRAGGDNQIDLRRCPSST